ncbi:hypothetical protein [Curtobacterium sp. RRHDQ10]|jgi:intracellular sulfur oxidation DsrE/DsrF family protein|uniref:DsrE family protein n=1 Tax=Curtobacterium phyllosphaerae TaxID=3413379 RepID=UPI003BF3FAA3
MNDGVEGREVVLHAFAPTAEALDAALRVARNAVQALESGTTVRLVVQGGAVAGLTTDGGHVEDVLTTMRFSDVEVFACGNSLEGADIDPLLLLDGVVVTPSAVAFIVDQQWQGAAYVRL